MSSVDRDSKNNSHPDMLFNMSSWLEKLADGNNEQVFLKDWFEGVCKWNTVSDGLVLSFDFQSENLIPITVYSDNSNTESNSQLIKEACQVIKKDCLSHPITLSSKKNQFSKNIADVLVIPFSCVASLPVQIEGMNTSNLYMVLVKNNSYNKNAFFSINFALIGLLVVNWNNGKLLNDQGKFERLLDVISISKKVNSQSEFKSAAISLCNEIAGFLKAERVCLGVQEKEYIKLAAIDSNENFDHRMILSKKITSAMEESVDQEKVVYYPKNDLTPMSNHNCELLAKSSNCEYVYVFPFKFDDASCMALSIELNKENAMSMEKVNVVYLLVEQLAYPLYRMYLQDQNVVRKSIRGFNSILKWILGAQNTYAKLGVLMIFCCVALGFFYKINLRVEAPLSLEAKKQMIVSAPFNSYIKAVYVKPGDFVTEGQSILGALDIDEIKSEYSSLVAETTALTIKSNNEKAKRKEVDASIAKFQALQSKNKADVLELRLNKALLSAPQSGYIIGDDISDRIGMSVKAGDQLFVIADINELRAVIDVHEDDQPFLRVGQRGEMRIVANPNIKIAFKVIRINPLASPKNGKNTFEVWGEILNPPDWLKPGMEGEGEILTDEYSCYYVFTRKVSNWIKLQLWKWL